MESGAFMLLRGNLMKIMKKSTARKSNGKEKQNGTD
jgi:hypothetical protein